MEWQCDSEPILIVGNGDNFDHADHQRKRKNNVAKKHPLKVGVFIYPTKGNVK